MASGIAISLDGIFNNREKEKRQLDGIFNNREKEKRQQESVALAQDLMNKGLEPDAINQAVSSFIKTGQPTIPTMQTKALPYDPNVPQGRSTQVPVSFSKKKGLFTLNEATGKLDQQETPEGMTDYEVRTFTPPKPAAGTAKNPTAVSTDNIRAIINSYSKRLEGMVPGTPDYANVAQQIVPFQNELSNRLARNQVAPPPASKQITVSPPRGEKQLDRATAAQFLKQAGGDKNKARALATQAGYTF